MRAVLRDVSGKEGQGPLAGEKARTREHGIEQPQEIVPLHRDEVFLEVGQAADRVHAGDGRADARAGDEIDRDVHGGQGFEDRDVDDAPGPAAPQDEADLRPGVPGRDSGGHGSPLYQIALKYSRKRLR